MRTETDLSKKVPSSVEPIRKPILPNVIILEIFKFLKLQDILSVKLVCRDWRVIATHSGTVYARYLKELGEVGKLSDMPIRFSPWTPMPAHWSLISKEKALKFSDVTVDTVAFCPRYFGQASYWYSFTSSQPFSDRNVLLGRLGKTYFFTPQGKLIPGKDLQLNAKTLLTIVNIDDPTKMQEISLLQNHHSSVNDLALGQIEYCFPVSEKKVVVVTNGGHISLWSLLTEAPRCMRKIEIDLGSEKVCRLNNRLILDNALIDLDDDDLSLSEHKFAFKNDQLVTFGSSLCAYDPLKSEIRYFTLNSRGLLEKKWEYKCNLFELLDNLNGSIFSTLIDMNEDFIVLECKQEKAFNLFVLTTDGKREFRPFIQEKVTGRYVINCSYSICTHLSGNILFYKSPSSNTIIFWHIPTRKCVSLDWTSLIYDRPTSCGNAVIQDIHLSKGKLTLLLSTGEKNEEKHNKFRLIQFDPDSTSRTKFAVSSVLKEWYYGRS